MNKSLTVYKIGNMQKSVTIIVKCTIVGPSKFRWEYRCVEEYIIVFYKGKLLENSSLLAVPPRNLLDPKIVHFTIIVTVFCIFLIL